VTPEEKMRLLLYGLAACLVLVAIIVLLSKLTNERLGALSNLRSHLATYSTYVVSVIGVINEAYAAFRYDTPFNWTGILILLGVTTATASARSGQKEVVVTAKGIEEVTDVILNTMPLASRKGVSELPIPAVTPKRVEPPPVIPGSVL
jgi:hypothetical protein